MRVTADLPSRGIEIGERLCQLAEHFENACGIPCVAVDAQGLPLRREVKGVAATTASEPLRVSDADADSGSDATSTLHQNPGCGFCRKAILRNADAVDCAATHRYGIAQAERFGGSFVYFCRARLVHLASSIVIDDRVVGALIAGSVSMIDQDDYLSEEMSTAACETSGTPSAGEVFVPRQGDSGEFERLRQLFRQIPYVPAPRVSTLARVLGDMTFAFNQKLVTQALWGQQIEGQQARISEYIHQLKHAFGQGAQSEHLAYPLAKEKELLLLVSQGDHDNAVCRLNELLAHIHVINGKNLAATKARLHELVIVMSRAALDGGANADEVMALNLQSVDHVRHTASIEHLASWLTLVLRRFTDSVFARKSHKHAELLQRAVHYLNANCTRRIDLQCVAAHLAVSPSHFSKIFKEAMGQGFLHYLNQIRIDRAKELLRNPSIPLVEIAGMVGFEDQSYFTKVFGRLTGISPGRFRKNRGQRLEMLLEEHD